MGYGKKHIEMILEMVAPSLDRSIEILNLLVDPEFKKEVFDTYREYKPCVNDPFFAFCLIAGCDIIAARWYRFRSGIVVTKNVDGLLFGGKPFPEFAYLRYFVFMRRYAVLESAYECMLNIIMRYARDLGIRNSLMLEGKRLRALDAKGTALLASVTIKILDRLYNNRIRKMFKIHPYIFRLSVENWMFFRRIDPRSLSW